MLFEPVEAGAPERAVRVQPFIEVGKRLGADPVQAALSVDARVDQPRLPEHPQVLGDRRLAQAEAIDELPDWLLAVAKHLENREAARLSEDLERRKLSHDI